MASLFDLFRLARAGLLLAREGALGLVDVHELPMSAQLAIRLGRLIERRNVSGGLGLAAAFTRLGPSWVKLGQFLATRPDVVGIGVARDLESLQDRMPPFAQALAVAEIERALGGPLSHFFSSFSEPVAAASVAQVHRATLVEDGIETTLAVKILRPGIVRRFRRDLSTFYFAARWIERLDPRARRLKPVEIVDTLARTTAFEMDFRLEAAALSEMAGNIARDPGFRVPAPDWNRTARGVLTMEWVDGIPLSDVPRIAAAGHNLKDLGAVIIQTFLRHAIRDGFFHADMHQGNLMIDGAGNLVAVDFGIMGRAGLKERRFLAEILHGFITRNYRRVAEVHFEAGYVPSHHSVENFAQAIRAIGEPIHNRIAEDISMAKLLTLLFEITALFDMATRIELVMLQKTMVVVEGVARKLDPRLNMWATAEPVVGGWIAENLGPRGKIEDLGRSLAALAKVVADAPDRLERLGRLIDRWESATESGRPALLETLEKTVMGDERRLGRLPMALLLAVLALLAWIALRM